jgi:hypothetical protein
MTLKHAVLLSTSVLALSSLSAMWLPRSGPLHPLGEDVLGAVHGKNDYSQKMDALLACAYSTIHSPEVTADGCVGQPNGTDCVKCTGINAQTKRPGTTSTSGIYETVNNINCLNSTKEVGSCILGTCVGPFAQPASCDGGYKQWGDQT